MALDKSSKSAELLRRRDEAVPRGSFIVAPVFVERASGSELWDVEGRRVIDFCGGLGCANVGHNHPRVIEAVKRRVVGRAKQASEGHEEILVVIRYKDRDDRRVVKTDYYLSNGTFDTGLAEFVRAAKAEHRTEECIQRSKSEAGLADYEVRTWRGWHHHQTLSLLATWFLVTEARRGKKIHAGDYGSPTPRDHLANPAKAVQMRYSGL